MTYTPARPPWCPLSETSVLKRGRRLRPERPWRRAGTGSTAGLGAQGQLLHMKSPRMPSPRANFTSIAFSFPMNAKNPVLSALSRER
jgi:hypothetical protein